MPEDDRRRLERLKQVVELNRHDGFGVRKRHQIELGAEDYPERAFRPDHQLGHVERLSGPNELFEAVSADPSNDLGEPAFDFSSVLPR